MYVSIVCIDVLLLQVSFIEELYLYGNRVNILPPEVGHLKKLRKLALNENLLAELPGSFIVIQVINMTMSTSYVLNMCVALIYCGMYVSIYELIRYIVYCMCYDM